MREDFRVRVEVRGERGRAALERAISGAAQGARRQNRSVVLFHMCSYPCGYPPEVAPTLPPGVARGPGNHPDLLQFVDAVERPRTAEGAYGEGGARAGAGDAARGGRGGAMVSSVSAARERVCCASCRS